MRSRTMSNDDNLGFQSHSIAPSPAFITFHFQTKKIYIKASAQSLLIVSFCLKLSSQCCAVSQAAIVDIIKIFNVDLLSVLKN